MTSHKWTMGNQLAIATQTRSGDDVIVGEGAHPAFFEAAAGAALSGIQFSVAACALAGTGGSSYTARGNWEAVDSTALVLGASHGPRGDREHPQPRGRPRVANPRKPRASRTAHVRSASQRIWTARARVERQRRKQRGRGHARGHRFDMTSVCFSSPGLGRRSAAHSVGRAVCGKKRDASASAGGGAMRQAGIIAAGALYALAHHRSRLADDHSNARALADKLTRVEGARVDVGSVETNLVNIDVEVPADAVARAARELGLLINAIPGPRAPSRRHAPGMSRKATTTLPRRSWPRLSNAHGNRSVLGDP